MNPQEVIDSVLSGQPRSGWIVFRYQKQNGVKRLAFRIFYLLLFDGVAATFLYTALTTHEQINFIFAGVFGLLSFITLILFINVVRELANAKSNMIVLTEKEVVKSWNSKIQYYPYTAIKNLTITNPTGGELPAMARKPVQYVDFRDDATGKNVNLVYNQPFGSPDAIFKNLNSKLS